jgi:hypothetical protein
VHCDPTVLRPAMCIRDANCFRSIRLHQSHLGLSTFRPVGLTYRVMVYAFCVRITKDDDAGAWCTTQLHAHNSVSSLQDPDTQTSPPSDHLHVVHSRHLYKPCSVLCSLQADLTVGPVVRPFAYGEMCSNLKLFINAVRNCHSCQRTDGLFHG